MRILRFLMVFVLSAVTGMVGCSQNAFVESAKKDTDAALLFEARKSMNSSNWAEAITYINRMSADARSGRETKATLASAYAGKCGLNLIRFADRISNAGSANIFPIFLNTFQNATVTSVADCQQAETILLSISTSPASRTDDENVLLAFVGFSKVGAILATYADTDHDGAADPGFDSCSTSQLPDAMLREVGTGVTIAVASLAVSGGSIGSALSGAITSACSSLSSVNPAYDFCSVTDPTAFSVNQVKALGGIVKSSDSPGLGTCAGSLQTCVCP